MTQDTKPIEQGDIVRVRGLDGPAMIVVDTTTAGQLTAMGGLALGSPASDEELFAVCSWFSKNDGLKVAAFSVSILERDLTRPTSTSLRAQQGLFMAGEEIRRGDMVVLRADGKVYGAKA